MKQKRKRLSQGEIEIMKQIWDLQPVTVTEVLNALNAKRDEPFNRNTVLVQLRRLEEKGWLAHDEDGRTFLYRATLSREAAQTRLARDFHERVFNGSSASLVRCLVEADGLDEAEIAELRKIINEAERRIRI